MNYKIYIIIITYNAMKWAERCFSSLRKSSVPVHAIAVDNGSTDGTQDFIKNNYPEVEFIQSEENLGFGKANNLGIEKAYKQGAEFFYLMNQDAWIFENTVAELLQVYHQFPEKHSVGILSPVHIDGSGEKLDIFLEKYIAMNFEKTRLISGLYFQSLKPWYDLSFINAAHWFLPKDTIEKVGGFNPYFFHYGEDNEYVNRLKFYRKKILLCTRSKAVHDGKQLLNKVDYTKYTDTSLDTQILDPNDAHSHRTELRELKKSIMKNIFTGNRNEARRLYQTLSRIRKKMPELLRNKEILKNSQHAFLDI